MTQEVSILPGMLPHRAEGAEAMAMLVARLLACGMDPGIKEALSSANRATYACTQRQLAVLISERVPIVFDPWIPDTDMSEEPEMSRMRRLAVLMAVETAPDLQLDTWGHDASPRLRDDPKSNGVWCAVWKFIPYSNLPK